MAWRDQLRPASFRGVAFETLALESEFGRDGVVQEPVGADTVYFDDLGRGARRYRVEAFILAELEDASDYAARRDALLAAVEKEGSGTLVHPTFGTITVQALRPIILSETIHEGRSANFRLEFVEVGDRAFPEATLDRPALARRRSTVAKSEMSAAFEAAWDAVGQLDYVVNRGIDEMQDQIDRLHDLVDEAKADLDDAVGTLDKLDTLGASLVSLAATPAELAEDVVDILEGIGFRRTLMRFAALIAPVDVTSSNPNDIQAETNARNAALLWRVIASAVAVEVAAAEEFDSYDATTRARDELTEVILADEERDDVTGTFYQALVDLRIGTWLDLTERALELPSIVDYTPPGMTSTLELAQLLYQDGDRAGEIEKRNNLPHGGFIAPQVLRVLSR